MVKIKGTEITNAATVGRNYTGVGNIARFTNGAATYLQYGFILLTEAQADIATAQHQKVLRLPPQSLVQEEPLATNITYTQNSGRFVERRGMLGKKISLQGTTGYTPFPQLPRSARLATSTAAVVSAEGPHSGLADFIELRNIFRSYAQIFEDPSYGEKFRKNTVLIFVNEKDDEAWIVEPTMFRMVRQVPRNKFSYNYDIQLITVARVEDALLIPDELTLFQRVGNFKQIVRNYVNDLSEANTVFGQALADVAASMQASRDRVTAVVNSIVTGMNDVVNGATRVFERPDLLRGIATPGGENFNSAIEAFHGIRQIIEDNPSASDLIPAVATEAVNSTPDAELVKMQKIVGNLSGRDELYADSFPATWEDHTARYDARFGFGGYNTALTDPANKYGSREITVLPNDDIVKIASRELGSAERFAEIVVLNNLKPPYISPSQETREENTLAPGDPILIPENTAQAPSRARSKSTVYKDPTFTGTVASSSATITTMAPDRDFRTDQWSGFTAVIIDGTGEGQERKIASNTGTALTVASAWTTAPDTTSVVRIFFRRIDGGVQKSVYDQSMGVDIRFTSDYDFALTNDGDLRLVDGVANLEQAVVSKFKTKTGELPAHVSYGLAFEPGRKGIPETLLAYRVSARRLLLSDPRIQHVEDFNVTLDRDVTSVEGFIYAAGGIQPFSVNTRGGR